MRNELIILLIVLYILCILTLCVRLYAIKKNPHRYNEIPGYEKYKSSKYFWPQYISYGKYEHPDRVLSSTMWLIAVLPFLYIYSIDFFYRIGSEQPCDTFCFIGPYMALLEMCIVFLVSFVVSSYLALFSKHPMDICYTIFHMGQEKTRYKKWYKWTFYLLILVLALFPLHLYTMTHGGFINESELTYYDGISDKTTFRFTEINTADIIYDNGTGEVISYVIKNPVGKKIDLCDDKIMFLDQSDYLLWEYVDARIIQSNR